MGNVLNFTRKKIAFVGETMSKTNVIRHTPVLYRLAGPSGEEVCPSLFTMDDYRKLDENADKMSYAMEMIYDWCVEELKVDLDEDPSMRLYAISLEDNRILYTMILDDEGFFLEVKDLSQAYPRYLSEEKNELKTEPGRRGNSIYIVGEVDDGTGRVVNTPVVNQIHNSNERVMFPGLFTSRTLEQFFQKPKFGDTLSCLFHCLLLDVEEQGIKTEIDNGEDVFKALKLYFIDRNTGQVLYCINTIQSREEGDILVPEDWLSGESMIQYMDISDCMLLDMTVEVAD